MPVTAGVYEQYISPTPFYTHSVFSGAKKGWRKRKAKEKKIETPGARGWNRYSGLLHRGVFFFYYWRFQYLPKEKPSLVFLIHNYQCSWVKVDPTSKKETTAIFPT
jgi:hypothetical protein